MTFSAPMQLGELLGEPLAGVDGVELDVAEGVALDLLAGGLHLRDDLGDAGALGQEDVDVALLVHDGLEALGLGGEVELHLGQEDGVDVPALLGQAEGGRPLLGLEQVVVAAGGLGGEVAAVAAHALVDDEHAGVGAVLADDVQGEAGALVGRGPGAQGLADRDDVVVDGLGQADDGELVVVLVEVGGQVGGGGVGVVAADGVQDVDAVGLRSCSAANSRGSTPSSTRPRSTRFFALVSLTRELPIGEPPKTRRTPACLRPSSSTTM